MTENEHISSKDIRANALKILSRREYTQKELQLKLEQQGFDALLITEVIQALQEKGWQSDERFAQHFVRYRQGQHKGPLRIKQELTERGVNDSIIHELVNERDACWIDSIKIIVEKKYRMIDFKDIKQRAKVYRYLQSVGFHFEQIKMALEK